MCFKKPLPNLTLPFFFSSLYIFYSFNPLLCVHFIMRACFICCIVNFSCMYTFSCNRIIGNFVYFALSLKALVERAKYLPHQLIILFITKEPKYYGLVQIKNLLDLMLHASLFICCGYMFFYTLCTEKRRVFFKNIYAR